MDSSVRIERLSFLELVESELIEGGSLVSYPVSASYFSDYKFDTNYFTSVSYGNLRPLVEAGVGAAVGISVAAAVAVDGVAFATGSVKAVVSL
ncbi:MAG: hypothetical protein LVS60_04185 [Nodosilinea sp. LVE1205-7]